MIARNASRSWAACLMTIAASLLAGPVTAGQAPPRAPVGQVGAPIDFTGQWVSYVTEDWRMRMMTPPKGEAIGVPLNQTGQAAVKNWDPAADEAAGQACKAYGAAAIMRIPLRIRIRWENPTTLRIDTDAGQQTRLLHFNATPAPGASAPPAEPSWQGQSVARWEMSGAEPTGSLTVNTNRMLAGYLRRNGVPYSVNATLLEQFHLVTMPDGSALLMVTSIVTDPENLTQPYILTSQFKKETNESRWNPQPCAAVW